jgi:hypothetical protein
MFCEVSENRCDTGLFIILPQRSPKLLPKCKLVPTWEDGFTRQELPG